MFVCLYLFCLVQHDCFEIFYLIHNTNVHIAALTKDLQFFLKNDTIADNSQCDVADPIKSYKITNMYNYFDKNCCKYIYTHIKNMFKGRHVPNKKLKLLKKPYKLNYF